MFDFPRGLAPIPQVRSGASLVVRIPFHTTRELRDPVFTFWSRGITVAPTGPRPGTLPAFTASSVDVLITAPTRILLGRYPFTAQVQGADRARGIFRMEVEVVATDQTPTPTVTPAGTLAVATATSTTAPTLTALPSSPVPPTATFTGTAAPPSPTRTVTPTASVTSTFTRTLTPTLTPTPSPTESPTETTVPSPTPTVTAASTSTPSVTPADTSTVTRLASGTVVPARFQTDPLRGIAVVDFQRPTLLGQPTAASDDERRAPVPEPTQPALVIGDSRVLIVDQELVVAPGGGAPPVRARYAGRVSVEIPRLGLGQYMVDVVLPSGVQVRQGMVLDAEGRLVGIASPERQGNAPAGHLYAVPAETAVDLFQRMGVQVISSTPVPSPTPRPVRTPPLTPIDD